MKLFLKVAVVLIVLLIGGYFFAHFFVKNKLESSLEKPIMSGVITYEDLDLSLFRGSVNLKTVVWKSNKNESNAEVSLLKVAGLSYRALLFNDHIKINKILLNEPHLFLQKKTGSVKKDSTSGGKNFDKTIKVKELVVEKGTFTFKNDSIEKLKVAAFQFKMEDIVSSKEIRNGEVPFQYKAYQFKAQDLFFDMNNLQELSLNDVEVSDKNILVEGLHMRPKYSKEKYIEHIPYEKDLMDLRIEELSIDDYVLHLETPKSFSAPLLEIKKLNFDIFRDKTVKDDVRKKDMYSKMLRDLDFGVKLDSINIASSYLAYGEQIKKPGPPATIFFEDFDVNISNVTNLDLKREDFPLTKVEINTQFMGKSKLNFNWNFKINDTLDRFTVRGAGYQIPDTSVNSFFKPAFNIEAEGGVEEVYYNFSGNRDVASGDVKFDYKKFKLHVLKKDRERKNKILSFLANIVVKNSSKSGGVSKNIGQVKRDKTKSFWNYFWSCLEAGIKKILI